LEKKIQGMEMILLLDNCIFLYREVQTSAG
jgi:hypothetical protein